MADLNRKMAEGHTVSDIDAVIDEVYAAHGEYDSLDERLDEMDSGVPSPASSTPAMDGTGSAGTADEYARADHVHPSDTSRASAAAEAEDRAALIEIIDTGPKNTIDINPPTGTDSAGITYTPNDDKSFTAQGTASKPLDSMRDFIIVRSDGSPVFHLANVCDDITQDITLIVRGDDHVENTYRHLFMFQTLGAKVPSYAHLPMIVNAQGKPYSKRDGDAFVGDFRGKGVLPEALFNYLTLLGWSSGDNREKMSREVSAPISCLISTF